MTETLSGSGDPAVAPTPYCEEPSAGPKQRRSGRLSLAVPILVIGTNDEGRVFSEQTHTVVLSRHGAGIVSRQKLVAEQELILRALESHREAEVRVVGEIGSQAEWHTYGVAFVNEELDFWEVEFPPPPVRGAVALILECGGCKQIVELKDGDFEYDICAIHGGLARFCNECGFLTVWRQSHESVPRAKNGKIKASTEQPQGTAVGLAEREPLPEKPEEFVSLADAMEGVDRRTRVRAKVNFFACVRSNAFGDDIVVCIDMSRGGVSFRSSHMYYKEVCVLIAVPFSPEAKDAPAIFVTGRIAHVRALPQGSMWRCGLEFIK